MRRFLRHAMLCAAAPLFLAAALAQDTRLDRLEQAILGAASATQFLTTSCAELRLASPAVVTAETTPSSGADPAPDIRALLRIGPDEAVRHRHVRLTCGGHALSEADNWYVPARLTPAMNRSLDETNTPFGMVVRPLNFHRRTVETARPTDAGAGAVLQVKAVLLTPQEIPISVVIENYSGELLGETK